MRVYDGDHVRCVLADQVEQLFTLHKLSSDAVNQEVLIDGVKVKEKYQAYESCAMTDWEYRFETEVCELP